MSVTVADVLATVDREPLDPGRAAAAAAAAVARPAPIHAATAHDVTFCTAALADAPAVLERLEARVLIVQEELAEQARSLGGERIEVILPSPSPRLDFARLVAELYAPPRPVGVDPSARIGAGAALGRDVYVGPLASIGDEVVVGDRTVIHAGVHVYGPVRIGTDVTIHAGTVVGAAGYGYERAPDGTLEPFPQIGSVEIGDGVEIGANACIDRGALGATRIGAGARIDNLVHIAHNVEVGRDAAVIANAMLGGGVRIGERAWIAPSATLRDHVDVGSDATVGLGSVVTRSVPAAATVAGNPARDIDELRALSRQLALLARKADDDR